MSKKTAMKIKKAKIALRNKVRAALRKACEFALADEPVEDDISVALGEEVEDFTECPVDDEKAPRTRFSRQNIVKYGLIALGAVWALKRSYRRGYMDGKSYFDGLFSKLYSGKRMNVWNRSGQFMTLARV